MTQVILITVADREILTTRFTSIKEAQAQMRIEMIEWGRVPKEAFEAKEYDKEGEYYFSEFKGWANDGWDHIDYDWSIVDLGEDNYDTSPL